MQIQAAEAFFIVGREAINIAYKLRALLSSQTARFESQPLHSLAM